ncbi:hypothetical protein CEXT_496601, partial [Caerostris extrusa]
MLKKISKQVNSNAPVAQQKVTPKPIPNIMDTRNQPLQRRVSTTHSYANVLTHKVRKQAPPAVGGVAAPLSESALALFKMLLVFMDDTSIDFDLLLDAVTNALPALESTQDCHMKA